MQPSYVSKEIKYYANLNEVKLYYFGVQYSSFVQKLWEFAYVFAWICTQLIKIAKSMLKIWLVLPS